MKKLVEVAINNNYNKEDAVMSKDINVNKVQKVTDVFDFDGLEGIRIAKAVSMEFLRRVTTTYVDFTKYNSYSVESSMDALIVEMLKVMGYGYSRYSGKRCIEAFIKEYVIKPMTDVIGKQSNVVVRHKGGNLALVGNKLYCAQNVDFNEDFLHLDEVKLNLKLNNVSNPHKRDVITALYGLGILDDYADFFNDEVIIKVDNYLRKIVINTETEKVTIQSKIHLENWSSKEKKDMIVLVRKRKDLSEHQELSLFKQYSGRFDKYIYCTSTYKYTSENIVDSNTFVNLLDKHDEAINKINDVRENWDEYINDKERVI